MAVLRKRLDAEIIRNFWSQSQHTLPSMKHCPSCTQSLKSLPLSINAKQTSIDICIRCQIVSYDREKFSILSQDNMGDTLSLEARKAIALHKMELVRENQDYSKTYLRADMAVECIQGVVQALICLSLS